MRVALGCIFALGAIAAAPAMLPIADAGDWYVRRTADLPMLLWWLTLMGLVARSPRRRLLRSLWLCGALTFALHVAVAFGVAHGWSHAAAVAHVEAASGFGPGIVFSHLFTLVWLADALWWTLAPRRYERRPRGAFWAVHGYLAFLVFNGTVVYETGFVRWTAALAFGVLGIFGWWKAISLDRRAALENK